MTDHIHASVTDGYETIDREHVTPQQLFDLGHDLLGRLDDLEYAFSRGALLLLEHLGAIDKPTDSHSYECALDEVGRWVSHYQQQAQKVRDDMAFMDAHE